MSHIQTIATRTIIVAPRHEPLFNASYRKVGGLRFLRIGRFQFSFCLCNAR
jgi:hypothetical protein